MSRLDTSAHRYRAEFERERDKVRQCLKRALTSQYPETWREMARVKAAACRTWRRLEQILKAAR